MWCNKFCRFLPFVSLSVAAESRFCSKLLNTNRYNFIRPAVTTSMAFRDRDFHNTFTFLADVQIPVHKRCWKCNILVFSSIFCPNCSSLQVIDRHINYFDLMGVPQTYILDEDTLKRKYYQLQSMFHPDRFSTRDEKERQLATQYSMLANEAYTTLSDPLARGVYLLEKRGVIMDENTKQTDKNFLMDMMEFNEALENVSTDDGLQELYTDNMIKINYAIEDLIAALRVNDMKTAINALVKMRYYRSNTERIKEMKRKRKMID